MNVASTVNVCRLKLDRNSLHLSDNKSVLFCCEAPEKKRSDSWRNICWTSVIPWSSDGRFGWSVSLIEPPEREQKCLYSGARQLHQPLVRRYVGSISDTRRPPRGARQECGPGPVWRLHSRLLTPTSCSPLGPWTVTCRQTWWPSKKVEDSENSFQSEGPDVL